MWPVCIIDQPSCVCQFWCMFHPMIPPHCMMPSQSYDALSGISISVSPDTLSYDTLWILWFPLRPVRFKLYDALTVLMHSYWYDDWCPMHSFLMMPSQSYDALSHMMPSVIISYQVYECKVTQHHCLLKSNMMNHVKDTYNRAAWQQYSPIMLHRSGLPSQDMLDYYLCKIRPVVEYACKM